MTTNTIKAIALTDAGWFVLSIGPATVTVWGDDFIKLAFEDIKGNTPDTNTDDYVFAPPSRGGSAGLKFTLGDGETLFGQSANPAGTARVLTTAA